MITIFINYLIILQEALEEDMLCTFHYVGVTYLEYIDGETKDAELFSKLITKERVEHILEKINYYGHSGKQVQELIFCSRKKEAQALSKVLNSKGYRTRTLTGDNNQNKREETNKM